MIPEISLARFADRFSQAFHFAAVKHARQRRKGTDIPYISHLLAVASLALEHGADEEEAIAALLHAQLPITRLPICQKADLAKATCQASQL